MLPILRYRQHSHPAW